MIYWQIFLAFFIPGILGYGGGPASIPLIEKEVVGRYEWMTVTEFSEVLAISNSLPSPIATKLAGYIGYEVGGILGSVIAIFASVAPSLMLMILLGTVLLKYKESAKVKRLTLYVLPVIAVLLGVLTWNFLKESHLNIGWLQTLLIVGISYFLIEKKKIHPAIIIVLALIYGGFFL